MPAAPGGVDAAPPARDERVGRAQGVEDRHRNRDVDVFSRNPSERLRIVGVDKEVSARHAVVDERAVAASDDPKRPGECRPCGDTLAQVGGPRLEHLVE